MTAQRHTVSAIRRLVMVLVAISGLVAVGAAPAWAESAPPRVHHVLPENGAVLTAAPAHFEIMFDVELVPGQVDVGLAPDATGELVALPGPPVLDGPLLVQPLPPLAAGRYTVGVQVLGAGGQLSRGTFGFTIDPGTPAPAAPSGSGAPGAWLVPVVGAALLLPVVGVTLRRRRQRARATR